MCTAVAAEVVEAVIADEPGIEPAGSGTGDREEVIGRVLDAGAIAEAALAEVVEVEVPLHALGPIDAEELEGIEIERAPGSRRCCRGEGGRC